MKFTITIEELRNFLRTSFNLPDDTAIEIVGHDTVSSYVYAIEQVTQREFPGTFLTTQKNAATIRLCELVRGLDLRHAKVAIEAPAKAIEHFNKTKRILPYTV